MFDVFYFEKKPNLFPHEVKVNSIEQAQQLCRTRFFWIVNYLCDYSKFDFLWEPVPWEAQQRHVWSSQHQVDSGTCLVPKSGYTDTNYRKDFVIQRLPNTPVVEIDHIDGNAGCISNTIKQIRYFDNYRDTLTRIANHYKDQYEHIWICSSVCDYSNFDFSWHPEPWQQNMLHVFPSNDQKFGDTFYMNTRYFADRINEFDLLDWFDLNFVLNHSVPRRSIPVITHNQDSHVDAIKEAAWAGPLAVFTVNCDPAEIPAVSLWREKTKTIVPLSPGASSVVVPKTAVPYIKTQLYDYPYVDKTHTVNKDQPLDIVFISNGESNADSNWQRLENRIIEWLEPNRLHRVDGINGRAAAYHAAACVSTTPWFFAVFAKLEIDFDFDWAWQPDRMQQPKHYIFHALNPVNGLIYGHQAMIAYNKKLTLSNTGQGLDFTLDSLHEVVPVLSGVARYNITPWTAWRTAFREALKLRANLPDIDSEYRLDQWLSTGWLDNGNWSKYGAADAVEYYEQVNGDFTELKKSYEWNWLASYALVKRGLSPD
jgi:hypothetical protein